MISFKKNKLMIPFNVEKYFIISDEVAEPCGIIVSVVWVNHCGINCSLQTSLKNLCITCDKFLVSSYTQQLLLRCAGRAGSTVQPSQSSHLKNASRRMTHTPAVSPQDFLQWDQQNQIQEGLWKENSFSTAWQGSTLKAARQMLIQRASKQTQQPSGWTANTYCLGNKHLLKYISFRTGEEEGGKTHTHKKKQQTLNIKYIFIRVTRKQNRMFKTLNMAGFCP